MDEDAAEDKFWKDVGAMLTFVISIRNLLNTLPKNWVITLGIDIIFVNKMLSFVSTFTHVMFGTI